ncbi:MAG: hypothetical protein ABW208_13775 [Pyrinomonadaceae bacterium]
MTQLQRSFLTGVALLAVLWGACPTRAAEDGQRRAASRAPSSWESARVRSLLRSRFQINLPRTTRVELFTHDEGSGVQFLCASMRPRDAARLKAALKAGPKSEKRQFYVVERGDDTPVGSLPYSGYVPNTVTGWIENRQFGNGDTVVVIENVFRRGPNETGRSSYAVLRLAESRGLMWVYFHPGAPQKR